MRGGSAITVLAHLGRAYSRWSSPVSFLARRFIHDVGRHCGCAQYGDVCLDLGAGTAPYAGQLSRALGMARYLTVDIAPTDKTHVVADCCQLPFKDSSVSWVVSFEVIQHVATPSVMLSEIARVLVPEGHLLLTFPFLYPECDFRDFHRWTLDGMRQDLVEGGFECVLMERRGGPCFAFSCALNWMLQHAVPGSRTGWRGERSWGGVLRAAVTTVITVPTVLLGWVSLAVDQLLPTTGYYMGAAVVARKTSVTPRATGADA